jgi:hypothetical protein
MFGLLEQAIIIVFSLHLGETSSSGSRNAYIHKSSIHCSSSHLSFPLVDFFLVSLGQASSLVILDTMTGCSVFSFSFGIFMFFLMFFFSS